jgi:phosphoglycerol transferase MdoB-like AlkP superfamily enzyme
MWFLAYFLLHLIVYMLIRIEFLVWNWAAFKALTSEQMLTAFMNGLRFDLAAVALTQGLCFLAVVWVAEKKLWRNLLLWFFALLSAAFFVVNTADVELYNFTARRFTAHSFFLVQDGNVSNLILPYIPLATASALIVLGYLFLSFKMIGKFKFEAGLLKKFLASFIVIVLSVLAARGGVQHKPLTFVDAKLFDNSYANNLVLNSTFTILKSASKKSLERVHHFEQAEMLAQLNSQGEVKLSLEKDLRPNIVIMILEGFSEEYSQLKDPEVMPYLNSLRLQSADFKNAYANGRRSIEGVAAILSGIPALMEEPFINSEFSANQVIGLGTLLKGLGYSTSFFHAANKGSMHFDSFTKSVGVENYYGRQDYPNAKDDDGTWGIFDEPFLNWTCETLTASVQKPFFTTIFTLSSHQPFKLPAEYESKFTASGLPILKTIQYTDFSVEKFMNCAQQKEWFKNTIFIFTADHTGPELTTNSGFVSRHKVPLFIYAPQFDWIKKINTSQPAQQIDILPTLLDVLSVEQKNINYLSRSLLRDGPKLIALYSDGHYELVGDVTDREKQLKAAQQYFSQGLYDNRLYYPTK